MRRSTKLLIEDILDCIKNIKDFTKGLKKENFIRDKLMQSAVVRQLEIIGEAVKNIPHSFRDKHKGVPWNKIAGMRDIIIHGYFRVDLDAVWKVIKKDLPELKQKILRIKKDLDKSKE